MRSMAKNKCEAAPSVRQQTLVAWFPVIGGRGCTTTPDQLSANP